MKRERGPWRSSCDLFPSLTRKINWILMLQSFCSLHKTLGVLRATPCSFGHLYWSKDILQSGRATVLDRTNEAANSPSPRKRSMKPCTSRRPKTRHFQYLICGVVKRVPRAAALLRDPSIGRAKEQLSLCRLRRSLATRAGLLKIIQIEILFPSVSIFRCAA